MFSKGKGILRFQGVYPTGKGYVFQGMFTKCRGGFRVYKVYILQGRDINFKVCLLKVEGDLRFQGIILQVGDMDFKVCLLKVGGFGVFKVLYKRWGIVYHEEIQLLVNKPGLLCLSKKKSYYLCSQFLFLF